jgi:ferredoxin
MAYKITENCTACATCIGECPLEAISEGEIYKIDPELCTDCGICADICPVDAIIQEG